MSLIIIGTGKVILLLWANIKLHQHAYRHPFPYLPFTPHCSTYIPYLTKAWKHLTSANTAVMMVTHMGRYPQLYISKHHNCHNFVLRNYHSRDTAGQDQELWMIDTVKQPFKEHCIWYNYTLLIWVIFQDQKKYIHTYIHSIDPQDCHKTMGCGTCHNHKKHIKFIV